MRSPSDVRRRWFGAVCLALAGLMLVLGQTLWRQRLQASSFVAYWGFCFGFTGLALIVSWLDIRAVRRDLRDQQRALLERTLQQIGEKQKQKRKENSPQLFPPRE